MDIWTSWNIYGLYKDDPDIYGFLPINSIIIHMTMHFLKWCVNGRHPLHRSRHPRADTPLWTEFLTHAYENITLPQTSFAGGKNKVSRY